ADLFIDLVGGERRDRFDKPLSDTITSLCRQVEYDLHQQLVILPSPFGHSFAISFAALILSEKPIHGAIAHYVFYGLPVFELPPFVEQSVESRSASAFPVWSAGNSVVAAQRLIGDCAAHPSIARRNREIEPGCTARQRFRDDVAR